MYTSLVKDRIKFRHIRPTVDRLPERTKYTYEFPRGQKVVIRLPTDNEPIPVKVNRLSDSDVRIGTNDSPTINQLDIESLILEPGKRVQVFPEVSSVAASTQVILHKRADRIVAMSGADVIANGGSKLIIAEEATVEANGDVHEIRASSVGEKVAPTKVIISNGSVTLLDISDTRTDSTLEQKDRATVRITNGDVESATLQGGNLHVQTGDIHHVEIYRGANQIVVPNGTIHLAALYDRYQVRANKIHEVKNHSGIRGARWH